MQPVACRTPAPAEAEALCALARQGYVETFGHMYAPKDLAAYFAKAMTPERFAASLCDPAQAFRVAEDAEGLVGYAQIGPMTLPFDTAGRRALMLDRLYVLKRAQGAGIGRILLDWSLDALAAQGPDDIYLSVFSENHRAIAIYEKRGFGIVGRYDYLVGEHVDDERIMRLRLTPP